MKKISVATMMTVAALVSACSGGGGGDSGGGSSSGFNVSALTGRWTVATPGYTAIAVPGNGTADFWMVAQDGGSMMRLNAASSLAVTGHNYDFTTGAATAVSGTFESAGSSLTLRGVSAASLAATKVSDLAGSVATGDLAGAWTSAGDVNVTWTLATSGAITGTSSIGCAYGGTMTPNASAAVYNVTVTETCSDGVKEFKGVGTLSADKSQMTVAGATTDNARGMVLFFGK
jgi:hypothetical protein